MKRFALYGLLLALVWIIPVERTDVAQLQPIEVIAVTKMGEMVILETDTEDIGIGRNAAEALENMQKTSPAVIYLDTAQFLLVADGAEEETAFLQKELKKSTKLCAISSVVSLREAARYLDVHNTMPKLRDWRKGDPLPCLQMINGRFLLKQP